MRPNVLCRSAILALGVAATACNTGMMSTMSDGGAGAMLLSVTPAGGASGVSTSSPIVLRFQSPMMVGMEEFVTLHDGNATGPLVAHGSSWSADSLTLTMTPAVPLRPGTVYTIHVGGGMMDAEGDTVHVAMHQVHPGCERATDDMMDGDGMMDGPGGMMGQEMGPGWTGSDGAHGMLFSFETAP